MVLPSLRGESGQEPLGGDSVGYMGLGTGLVFGRQGPAALCPHSRARDLQRLGLRFPGRVGAWDLQQEQLFPEVPWPLRWWSLLEPA